MTNVEQTYWAGNGRYQSLSTKLEERVPSSGDIKGSKNRKLEKFRKASNAYYDIFNNGGWNRGRSIGQIFGPDVMYNLRRMQEPMFSGEYRQHLWNRIHEVVEPVMDQIILEAAQEQGIDQ